MPFVEKLWDIKTAQPAILYLDMKQDFGTVN